MKQPHECATKDDLQALIDSKLQESITLDYKASDSLQNNDPKKDEISKDVSAFANSAGGVIIYGIKEDEKGHFPEELDAGSDPAVISKEWLEQVISSRIQRRIDGIRIKPIWLDKNRPGKVAYVVIIPQSNRAPHQARDKKFYKRHNFASIPMEEYEVRDVSRRLEAPDLRAAFGLGSPFPINKRIALAERNKYSYQIYLGVTIINDSPEPAYHCITRIWFDNSLYIQDLHVTEFLPNGDGAIEIENEQKPAKGVMYIWNADKKGPLLYGVPGYIIFAPYLKKEDGTYFLRWQINAPRMSERSGTAVVNVKDGWASLTAVRDGSEAQ